MTTATNKSPARLVITSGEPAGIGPDICLRLADASPAEFNHAKLYILADPDLLVQRAAQLKLNPPYTYTTISNISINIISRKNSMLFHWHWAVPARPASSTRITVLMF